MNKKEAIQPKVKMWQWVYRSQGRRTPVAITGGFYKNESDFHKNYTGKIIQRADWTEIEVEETQK